MKNIHDNKWQGAWWQVFVGLKQQMDMQKQWRGEPSGFAYRENIFMKRNLVLSEWKNM